MGRIDISTSSGSKKDWSRVFLGVAISVICLGVLAYFTDFDQLKKSLSLANYNLVLVAALLTLVWLSVRGIVWRTLLEEKASFSQVFLTLNEGYLLNNFLPFRLGEVGRAFLLGRKSGLGFWRVLSSILIERTLDMALAAGLLLSTLPFVVGASWAFQAGLAAGGLVGLVFFILYLTARHRLQAEELFHKITLRVAWLAKLSQKSITTFLDGLIVLTDSGRFFRVVVGVLQSGSVSTWDCGTLFTRCLRSVRAFVGWCIGIVWLKPGGIAGVCIDHAHFPISTDGPYRSFCFSPGW